MDRFEMSRWGRSLVDPQHLALQALHLHTRERFQALSKVADGIDNATSWAASYDRQIETFLSCVSIPLLIHGIRLHPCSMPHPGGQPMLRDDHLPLLGAGAPRVIGGYRGDW